MTKKTNELNGAVAKVSYICDMCPTDIETSEVKYLNPSVKEGDYLVSINFMKVEGIGLYNIQGI